MLEYAEVMADCIRPQLFWERNILSVEWCVIKMFVVLDTFIMQLSIVYILKGNLVRNILFFIPGP